nr:hypothetical protein CFP56_19328 [Quercus suber]
MSVIRPVGQVLRREPMCGPNLMLIDEVGRLIPATRNPVDHPSGRAVRLGAARADDLQVVGPFAADSSQDVRRSHPAIEWFRDGLHVIVSQAVQHSTTLPLLTFGPFLWPRTAWISRFVSPACGACLQRACCSQLGVTIASADVLPSFYRKLLTLAPECIQGRFNGVTHGRRSSLSTPQAAADVCGELRSPERAVTYRTAVNNNPDGSTGAQ